MMGNPEDPMGCTSFEFHQPKGPGFYIPRSVGITGYQDGSKLTHPNATDDPKGYSDFLSQII